MSVQKILTVVGARPQFMKASVVSQELQNRANLKEVLVHTGQHYDLQMSDVFFEQLGIPRPHYNLHVGSDKPAYQYGKMLTRLLPVFEEENPDILLVYGDTNSTFAAAMVASTLNIPVVHVESGVRTFQRRDMPEEVNRILTDKLSTLNLTCTTLAKNNLHIEGHGEKEVIVVGDPMFDLFKKTKANLASDNNSFLSNLGVTADGYHLATIHRPQNTNDLAVLTTILSALDNVDLPVLLPVHPRVQNQLDCLNWASKNNLRLLEPCGYFELIHLLLGCKKCFTDSGGVTREAFFAKKPAIVPMQATWWPEIVATGWAVQIGVTEEEILEHMNNFTPASAHQENLFGDGQSARKIVDAMQDFLGERYSL